MSQPARVDADRLLGFVGEAQALAAPEPFTPPLLDRLAAALECDFATYYRLDVARRAPYAYVACSREAEYPQLAASLAECPQLAADDWSIEVEAAEPARGDNVRTWSEAYPRDMRSRFETTSWASVFRVVDCAWTLFSGERSERSALVLHRQERDFNARDRRKLAALRPHVSALIRDARARRLLAHLLAAVDVAEEREPRGVLLLGARFEVERASPPARRIIKTWFGKVDRRLPAPLERWLENTSGSEPLRLERRGRRLVVVTPTSGVLVLTEEARPPDSLTPRELEVLRGVASGKSTQDIARMLWVTPATVSKHLQHIYRKLGVTSRTAAVAAAGAPTEWLDGNDGCKNIGG